MRCALGGSAPDGGPADEAAARDVAAVLGAEVAGQTGTGRRIPAGRGYVRTERRGRIARGRDTARARGRRAEVRTRPPARAGAAVRQRRANLHASGARRMDAELASRAGGRAARHPALTARPRAPAATRAGGAASPRLGGGGIIENTTGPAAPRVAAGPAAAARPGPAARARRRAEAAQLFPDALPGVRRADALELNPAPRAASHDVGRRAAQLARHDARRTAGHVDVGRRAYPAGAPRPGHPARSTLPRHATAPRPPRSVAPSSPARSPGPDGAAEPALLVAPGPCSRDQCPATPAGDHQRHRPEPNPLPRRFVHRWHLPGCRPGPEATSGPARRSARLRGPAPLLGRRSRHADPGPSDRSRKSDASASQS